MQPKMDYLFGLGSTHFEASARCLQFVDTLYSASCSCYVRREGAITKTAPDIPVLQREK